MKGGMNAINETGNRYNRLVVISFHGTNHYRKRVWICKCDCGKEVKVVGRMLRSGNTQSCGCWQIDRAREANTKHGENRVGMRTARYEMWLHARERAKKKKVKFDLSVSDIPLPSEFCPVLGIKLSRGITTRCDNSPSLDRIIPKLGYVKGNIRVISHRANYLKSNSTIHELKLLVWDAECLNSTEGAA